MHAPLELLAGVVAAAASTPLTSPVTPPTSSSIPIPIPIPIPVPFPSTPSSVSAPISIPHAASQTQTLLPLHPHTAVSIPRAPSPMFQAPIPHLTQPPSPPSDVTASTGQTNLTPSPSHPQKRVKSRHSTSASRHSAQHPRRVLKRPFEAATSPLLTNHPSQRGTHHNWTTDKSPSVGNPNGSSAGDRDHKPADDESQDNKRAMRAERNRQSAAASRERKKRHIKDLEERVKYLTECNTALQYRLDAEKRAFEERELRMQQEIARLRHQLSRESAFRSSPQQNHPMTLHHLTHPGPVTY